MSRVLFSSISTKYKLNINRTTQLIDLIKQKTILLLICVISVIFLSIFTVPILNLIDIYSNNKFI